MPRRKVFFQSKRRLRNDELIRNIRRKNRNKYSRVEKIIKNYHYMETMISIILVENSKRH